LLFGIDDITAEKGKAKRQQAEGTVFWRSFFHSLKF
jgi:hypothetical protein